MARTFGTLGVLLVVLLLSSAARATDQLDLSIALKTLPLLTNKMTGSTNVAVIYDPAIPATRVDAEAIKSILDNDLAPPDDLKLVTQLISTNQMSGMGTVKIAFLAHGLPQSDFTTIYNASSTAGALTICTDIECVKENQCILGIVSKPQVQVYYSASAAEAAKVTFASAFTMLAKQIRPM